MFIQEKLAKLVRAFRPSRKHLPTAIDSKVSVLPSLVGDLFLYESTIARGTPVLLVHSVNAAASSYEMRPLFEGIRGSRPVFAFDLPGFGLSERGDRQYDRATFRQAIETVLEHIRAQCKKPCDIVALSLGCEFAASAARARPDLVRSLTMISPSGFNLPSSKSTQSDKLRIPKALLTVLGAPLFAALATRASIEHYLRKSFIGAIDRGLARYDWLSAHQNGARFAVLAFLSGKLFDENIRTQIYEKLECPVHVVYDADAYTSFATLHTTAQYRGWTATRIAPTNGLPQFDRPERTLFALEEFWSGLRSESEAEDSSESNHRSTNVFASATEQSHGR